MFTRAELEAIIAAHERLLTFLEDVGSGHESSEPGPAMERLRELLRTHFRRNPSDYPMMKDGALVLRKRGGAASRYDEAMRMTIQRCHEEIVELELGDGGFSKP